MPDLSDLAPNYRRARQQWSDSPLLERHEEALEECFAGSTHGLVEHVKSFVECVCHTVMTDFGYELSKADPSLTEIVKGAFAAMGYQHPGRSSPLAKMLSGCNKLSDALTEMRNERGEVAHGKDGFEEMMSADHARAFAFAGDAILAVLLNALDGTEPNLALTRQPYTRFERFNESIDACTEVESGIDDSDGNPLIVLSVSTPGHANPLEIAAPVSEILYHVDRTAYIEVLRASPVDESNTNEEGAE